jgi:hypothetical protein
MFEDYIINDCLYELPPFGSFPMRSFMKADSPIRLVEAVDSVFDGKSLEGPVAGIYRVVFVSGEEREILTRGDPLHTDFDSSVFLKDGRTSDQLRDIVRLVVPGPEGVVPDGIKDALRKYEADRDIAAAKFNFG